MDKIDEAFSAMNRANFLPQNMRGEAGQDIPLPIGYGQTNSQPSTVKKMLYWLDILPGQKILDVGSGSGWTTALISNLVGKQGRVYAVELVPELVAFGRDNCLKSGVANAKFFQAGTEYGLPEHAPYDRILVSAGAETLPAELVNQLKTGGKLVIPVGQDILEITKASSEQIESIVHPGFLFVPLIKP